jgi:acetylglutamate kinase
MREMNSKPESKSATSAQIPQSQGFTGGNATGPIVVKVGGAALESPAEAAAIATAITAMHRAWPTGIVVVHGGGTEVDRHLAALGLKSEKRDGIRITPSNQIEEVVAVLAGKMNKRLVGQLQQQGVPAVGLCLGDGFLVRTVKAAHYLFDPGHVGRAVGGDPTLVQTLLPAGFLPVLCSIGLDAQGLPLNVNADDAASDVARLLDASSLMLLTDVPGVLDGAGNLLPQLTADEIETRIANGEITGGMVPKVRSAIVTANEAGIPVTIASWRDASKFHNLGRGEWTGTRVLPMPAPQAIDSPDFSKRGATVVVQRDQLANSVALAAGSL